MQHVRLAAGLSGMVVIDTLVLVGITAVIVVCLWLFGSWVVGMFQRGRRL